MTFSNIFNTHYRLGVKDRGKEEGSNNKREVRQD